MWSLHCCFTQILFKIDVLVWYQKIYQQPFSIYILKLKKLQETYLVRITPANDRPLGKFGTVQSKPISSKWAPLPRWLTRPKGYGLHWIGGGLTKHFFSIPCPTLIGRAHTIVWSSCWFCLALQASSVVASSRISIYWVNSNHCPPPVTQSLILLKLE